jgi:hypothetical protein
MNPGRRTVTIFAGGAVSLQLVQPIERDIQPVTPLILDDCDFERGIADGDSLDTPVDAYPVLQMDDIVAYGQRTGSRIRGRLAVAPWPAQAAGPPEDLMIGQHPERRHHETAVERSHGERRFLPGTPILLQQLLHSLHLTFVVTQDQRGQLRVEEASQPVEIAVDAFGRKESKLEGGPVAAQYKTRECAEASLPLNGILKDGVPARHVLTQPTCHGEVMLGLIPCPADLLIVWPSRFLDEQGVGGEELEERAADRRTASLSVG